MYCRECGNQLPQSAQICMKCGVPAAVAGATRPVGDIAQDATMRMLLPVGRSGYAIAAGYLGLFSLLILPAPFALLFGILAIRHIRRDGTKHGMGRAIFGVVMGTLGTAVLGLFLFAVSRG